MRLDKKDMVLYAVTDRHWLNGESLYSQVEKALKGGAPLIKILSLLPAFSCCIHISFEVHPRILEIIDLLYNFSVTQIFPRNTFIDITDKFIVKSAAQTGKLIY